MVLKVSLNTGINRIRLEFKVASIFGLVRFCEGLIESDWNLKKDSWLTHDHAIVGLIESDWNLKESGHVSECCRLDGLIESDWNLK